MIIQRIGLYLSGAVWTDGPSNVSWLDPSGAVQIDAEHPARTRKVRFESLLGRQFLDTLRGMPYGCGPTSRG